MQLEVFFAGNRMATRTFREKEQQQSQVFLDVIFMSTLRRITKKELEQVVKNNGDEFYWKKGENEQR